MSHTSIFSLVSSIGNSRILTGSSTDWICFSRNVSSYSKDKRVFSHVSVGRCTAKRKNNDVFPAPNSPSKTILTFSRASRIAVAISSRSKYGKAKLLRGRSSMTCVQKRNQSPKMETSSNTANQQVELRTHSFVTSPHQKVRIWARCGSMRRGKSDGKASTRATPLTPRR